MRRALDGSPRINTRHGQSGWGHFGKHLGYDYDGNNMTVKAPEAGRIAALHSGGSGGKIIELSANGRRHRFLHLNRVDVRTGQQVSEGQAIGISGSTGAVTGPHLHHDVRKDGTAWNASFSNYFDWEKMLAQAPSKMPPVGSRVKLYRGVTRTTFRAGTTSVAGQIRATDDSFIYLVRGYDPKYPNRVIINSKSGGGDGIALALYYTNGSLITGWDKV